LPTAAILASRGSHIVTCQMTAPIIIGFISDTHDLLLPWALNALAGSDLIINGSDPERATPPGARDHHRRAYRHRRLGSVAADYYVP